MVEGLSAIASADGRSVELRTGDGARALTYGELAAKDGDGRSLAASMTADRGVIALHVDDADARYPLVIDPLVWGVQQAKLVAASGAKDDALGYAVAVRGDVAIVGAPGSVVGGAPAAGRAQVFVRASGTWTLQQTLAASDGVAGDRFGMSVAMRGDVVIVGAPGALIGSTTLPGAAYVFVKSGGTWAEQAKLVATGGVAGDRFGYAVGLDAGEAIVGAWQRKAGGQAQPRLHLSQRQRRPGLPQAGALSRVQLRPVVPRRAEVLRGHVRRRGDPPLPRRGAGAAARARDGPAGRGARDAAPRGVTRLGAGLYAPANLVQWCQTRRFAPPMAAKVLVAIGMLHVVLMWLPPATWSLWLARFVALETSLVASAIGVAALWLGRGHPFVQGLALLCVACGSAPALAAIPTYLRERQSFSPLAWLTGGVDPGVECRRDVELGEGLLADVFFAPGVCPHPFVVVVHGGSWRSGDKGEVPRESRALAAAGFTVIDVRYRLAPEAPFPAAVQDVVRFLEAIRAGAAALDVDPERGALLGRSAGAQIALIAAYADASSPPESAPARVRAVVSLYGPTDLAWGHAHPFVPDVVDGPNAIEAYLGGAPSTCPERYREATPMTWVEGATAATLILHGTAERCVRGDHAERLARALGSHGKRAKLVWVPFADHGFDVRPGGLGTQLARGVILDFLRTELA